MPLFWRHVHPCACASECWPLKYGMLWVICRKICRRKKKNVLGERSKAKWIVLLCRQQLRNVNAVLVCTREMFWDKQLLVHSHWLRLCISKVHMNSHTNNNHLFSVHCKNGYIRDICEIAPCPIQTSSGCLGAPLWSSLFKILHNNNNDGILITKYSLCSINILLLQINETGKG